MRALARRLGRDEELWGLTGLLHDIDLEEVGQDPHRHALRAAEMLKDALPDEALQAIRAHNGENLGIARQAELDFALAAAENLTGLIAAAALILPSKSLLDLKPKSVLKRMKEPRFAAGANREIIREGERLGLALEDLVAIAVFAMQSQAAELG